VYRNFIVIAMKPPIYAWTIPQQSCHIPAKNCREVQVMSRQRTRRFIFKRLPFMPAFSRIVLVLFTAATLAGCSNMTHQQQRVLSGGAIGAAGGAVITAVVGGPVLAGAAIGAGVGAVAGAVTH
jgi:hypothetical protein